MTNYEKLFGTPEKAARTLNGMECMFRSAGSCAECAIADANDLGLCSLDVDRLLEWLESEVRDD